MLEVTISVREYEELLADSLKLEQLLAAGAEEWIGFAEAIEGEDND